MPYGQRLITIRGLLPQLEELFLFAEKKWFDVSQGCLTDREIHDLQMEVKEKKSKMMTYHLQGLLPDRRRCLEKAAQDAATYMTNFYHDGE